MSSRDLEDSWAGSRLQFDALNAFVNASDALAPAGDVSYRSALYSSWVLLTYAATEAGIDGLGKACMNIFGREAPNPGLLPPEIMNEHRMRSLNHLAGLASARQQDAEFAKSLSVLDAAGWHERSRLLALDQNVWPDSVREWMYRIGVAKERVRWMSEPSDEHSDTLESRIRELIFERNLIAHGGRPDNLLSAALMCAWLADARRFVERVGRVLQCHVADLLHLTLERVGDVDPTVTLGNSTVAILELRSTVAVGDHLLLTGSDAETKSCLVVSLQNHGQELVSAVSGLTSVAITVDRRVQAAELCLPV